jgi:hypothetical protein
MKKLLTLTAVIVLAIAANAQQKAADKKVTFGVGPTVSLPFGSFGDAYSFGIGAEIEATYHASSSFQAFAQAGYANFSGKTIMSIKIPSVGYIPVLVGGRYVTNGFSIGAGIGYGNFTGSGSSSGGFAYSPQIGYNFGKVNLIGSYNGVSTSGSTSSFAAVKAYYNF